MGIWVEVMTMTKRKEIKEFFKKSALTVTVVTLLYCIF